MIDSLSLHPSHSLAVIQNLIPDQPQYLNMKKIDLESWCIFPIDFSLIYIVIGFWFYRSIKSNYLY